VPETEGESALGRHSENADLPVGAKVPKVLVVSTQKVNVGFFGDVRASTFTQHKIRGGAADAPVVTTSASRLRTPQQDGRNGSLVAKFKFRVRNILAKNRYFLTYHIKFRS